MHQSKKELILRQWNSQISTDLNDQMEKDMIYESGEFSREMGTSFQQSVLNKK